jgi:very-short-patch-repair endonuclease
MRNAEDLLSNLKNRGAVHTTQLRNEGFSPYAMSQVVAGGGAQRVRRSWLVTPSCGSDERRAVEVGGRVTCVSEAARRNLWTPTHDGVHLAVPGTASRMDREGVLLHWANGPVPVSTHVLHDPPINVLFHVARCLPLADALSVWESAIRKKAVDPEELRRIRWRSTSARRLADLASHLSDSGVETRFVLLMRALGVPCRQQAWIDGRRVDGLVGERLIVQIDGFAHHQAADRRRDLRADARLVLRGYTVLRFDFVQVLLFPDEVTATIAAAIAQGLHLADRR